MSARPKALDRLQAAFEIAIVRLLQLLLSIVILAAVVELCIFTYGGIVENFFQPHTTANTISSVPDLQRAVQRAFAAVLLVVLGLELLETLRTYFTEHRVRLRIIMVVALIAVGRHIIQLDFEHASGELLAGTGFLVVALAAGYYLLVRTDASGQEREAIGDP